MSVQFFWDPFVEEATREAGSDVYQSPAVTCNEDTLQKPCKQDSRLCAQLEDDESAKTLFLSEDKN